MWNVWSCPQIPTSALDNGVVGKQDYIYIINNITEEPEYKVY